MPVPFPSPFTASCPNFTVRVSIVKWDAYTITRHLANGAVKISFRGRALAKVTNEKTGEAVIENIGGPANVIFYPNGTGTEEVSGHALVDFTAAVAGAAGVPQLTGVHELIGGIDLTFNSSGLTSFTYVGHVTDVCALLS